MTDSSLPSETNSATGAPIEFHCSTCQQMLRVPPTAAGRDVRCPQCQSVMAVPSDMAGGNSDASSAVSSSGDVGSGTATPPTTAAAPVSAEAAASTAASATATGADDIQETSQQFASMYERPPSEAAVRIKGLFDRIVGEVRKIFVGQQELVEGTLIALFSGGHVLIESVPGLGKTLFVRTLGKALGCRFGRIQFTADLMPSDITGAPIFNMKTQEFTFRPGPVFTQLLLADEINRSPAKTHAALLEIMQEYRVTVDGIGHPIERPFLVMATQNPIESEGTYNLPEAQLDRFMFKIVADYLSAAEEANVLKMHRDEVDLERHLEEDVNTVTTPQEILEITQLCCQVHIDDKLIEYINSLVRLTREWPQFHMGGSPRAGIALVQGARTLAAFYGRDYAVPDDVLQIALPSLRHRVMLTAEAEVEGHQVDQLLLDMIRTVEVPRL